MTDPVVTRFAPSPTGFLHIGGARTALFNWLFSKANNGKMLLRIEDTDRQRSTDAAVKAILDGLDWLGLDYEGEPVSQFARLERHQQAVQQLLDSGHAYKCYASPEELSEMRALAKSEGRPPIYDGRWRDRDPSEAPKDVKPVIRLKTAQSGETTILDEVQGKITWKNKDLDDFIILRSDGTPTYMLAVVVDDHDMGVTHIIRGDDHLTNAARQTQIYEAFGWDVPVMAHIPLIHGADGAKLSKRHGALGVEAYRDMGYLPDALRNYLARLGWAHGDNEIFSTEQAVEWFTLDAIGKSPSRFDFAKLENLNGHYIRDRDESALVRDLELMLKNQTNLVTELPLPEKLRHQLVTAMPSLKERAKTLVELWESSEFLRATRPLEINEKAQKILDEGGVEALRKIYPILESLETWTLEEIESKVREFTEQNNLKLGKVAQPLRAAIVGTMVSPGIFDVMAVLEKQAVLDRIEDQFVTHQI